MMRPSESVLVLSITSLRCLLQYVTNIALNHPYFQLYLFYQQQNRDPSAALFDGRLYKTRLSLSYLFNALAALLKATLRIFTFSDCALMLQVFLFETESDYDEI